MQADVKMMCMMLYIEWMAVYHSMATLVTSAPIPAYART